MHITKVSSKHLLLHASGCGVRGSHDQFTLIEMACYDWTEQEMQFFFSFFFLQIIKATIIFISKEHRKLDLYKKFCTCILLFQSGV